MKTIEAKLGEHVSDTAKRAVDLVAAGEASVSFDFNDITLTAKPGMTAADICAAYGRQSDERRTAYLASPEYKESQRRAEEAQRRKDAEFADLSARAPAQMKLRDGMDAEFEKYKETNSADPYSARCVSYANDWARFMEAKLAAGKALEAVWKECSHAADHDGITGFMYGAACGALARFWFRGDELRRLHNADYGVTEEKAKGGTSTRQS